MEKKTYRVSFMARLTEDDVRAMNKCFYDAMNEAMDIHQLWELQLEEVRFDGEPNPEATDLPAWNIKKYEPSLEELMMIPMRHIQNIKDCLELCKSKRDVLEVLKLAPDMFGEFTVEFDDEYRCFTVTNIYFDDEDGEYEEEYMYDYPDDWDPDLEWCIDEDE